MKYFMQKAQQTILVLFAAALLAPAAWASSTGEVNFADLSSHYGEPKVEINLTSALMRMVGSFAKAEDPEVGEILSKLEFIKVRVYQTNNNVEEAVASIESVSKSLKNGQWETLVTVNDEGERVRIFSKSTNDIIDGVVVMAVSPEEAEGEGGEAVFINIVGQIDPAQISKVTESLDIEIGQ